MRHIKTIDNSLALYLIAQHIVEPISAMSDSPRAKKQPHTHAHIDGFLVQGAKINLFSTDAELKAITNTLSLDDPAIYPNSLFEALSCLRNGLLPIRYSDAPNAHVFSATMYDKKGHIFEKNEYEIGTLFSDTIKHLLMHSKQYVEATDMCKPATNLSVNVGEEHIEFNASHDDWLDFIVHLECCIRADTYATIKQNMCSHLHLKQLDLNNSIHRETLLRSYNVFMGSGCLSSIYTVFDSSLLKTNPTLHIKSANDIFVEKGIKTTSNQQQPRRQVNQRMHHH